MEEEIFSYAWVRGAAFATLAVLIPSNTTELEKHHDQDPECATGQI